MKLAAKITIDRSKSLFLDEGVSKVEIVDEYGFIQSSASFDVQSKKLIKEFPELISKGRRVPVDIIMILQGGVKLFSGYADESGGNLSAFRGREDTTTINLQGILSDLTKETLKLKKAYINTDYSKIVAEAVSIAGFRTDGIKATGIKAGEKLDDGRYFLSLDDELLGEVVTQAVSATGFIANTTVDKKFYFVDTIIPKNNYSRESFDFIENDKESDIFSAQFSNGEITDFISTKKIVLLEPGYPVSIYIPGDSVLTSNYYVTKTRYVASVNKVETLLECGVSKRLPNLKAA